jgi:uncharacterized protein (TIGR02300 family)
VASERPSRAFDIDTSAELRGTSLAKATLGDKQVCPNCTAKFYDLGRRPASCPKCATVFDPQEEGVRARRSRSKVASHDPATDEEEEEAEAKETPAETDDEEAVEAETPEVDADASGDTASSDDDDAEAPSGDELPPGFSEADPDLEAESSDDDDDSVPMLDDEEEFPEDEIGDLPADDDEESS